MACFKSQQGKPIQAIYVKKKSRERQQLPERNTAGVERTKGKYFEENKTGILFHVCTICSKDIANPGRQWIKKLRPK